MFNLANLGEVKFLAYYVKIITKLTTAAYVELMEVEIFQISFFSDLSMKTERNEEETNSSNRWTI